MSVKRGIFRIAKLIKWVGRIVGSLFVVGSAHQMIAPNPTSADEYGMLLMAGIILAISEGIAWILEGFSSEQLGTNVIVVAHSTSASREARNVLLQKGWAETLNLQQADAIVVVCQSSLSRPLKNSYRSFEELNHYVKSQLNIGSNFHMYVYKLDVNKGVEKIDHSKYPAD